MVAAQANKCSLYGQRRVEGPGLAETKLDVAVLRQLRASDPVGPKHVKHDGRGNAGSCEAVADPSRDG